MVPERKTSSADTSATVAVGHDRDGDPTEGKNWSAARMIRSPSGRTGDGVPQPDFDAVLDPWCLVPLQDGEDVLFGYALSHPGTGGLSWLVSTPIRDLNPRRDRAVTASGRRYRLLRRIELEDIPDEGDEAWVAFDLMLGGDVADIDAVPPISADPPADTRWVAACKMARHLGLAPPQRSPKNVEAFIAAHLSTYLRRRASG